MAHFDLYRPKGYNMGYLVDVQADIVSHLDTRMMVPLYPTDRSPRQASRLNPVLLVDDVGYALQTQWMGAMKASSLGRPVGSVQSHRDEITAALDFLLTGF